jgi:hypothetical protein
MLDHVEHSNLLVQFISYEANEVLRIWPLVITVFLCLFIHYGVSYRDLFKDETKTLNETEVLKG